MRHLLMFRLYAVAAAGLLAVQGGARAETESTLRTCNACHGAGGVSTQERVPSIAGLSEFVVEDYLLTFADKARPCRADAFAEADAADHCALAAALGEPRIRELAGHYAGAEFSRAKQETDAALAARGAKVHEEHCEKCHSDGGSNADDDASVLAGQWMPYLRQALSDYRDDSRPQPKSMKVKVDRLGADDLEALVHFYGRGR